MFFLLVLVSLGSLMNLVIDAIAKLPIFPNLLKFPISCVRFPLKKTRNYCSRKAVMPIIIYYFIVNYLIIREFVGGG